MNSTLIQQIREENDIEKMRSLFIDTIKKHESQLVEIDSAHMQETDLLQQQLSDSNAAYRALQEKINEKEKLDEEDTDLARDRERELRAQVKQMNQKFGKEIGKLKKENQQLRSQLKSKEGTSPFIDKEELKKLKEENEKFRSQAIDRDELERLKQMVRELETENRKVKTYVGSLVKSVRQCLEVGKKAAEDGWNKAKVSEKKLMDIKSGLKTLKRKVHAIQISKPIIPVMNIRIYRVRLQKRLAAFFQAQNKKPEPVDGMNVQLLTQMQRAADQATSLKLMSIQLSTLVAILQRNWTREFHNMKRECLKCVTDYRAKIEQQKAKTGKSMKAKGVEIRKLKDEIGLLKTSQKLADEKIRDLREAVKSKRKTRAFKLNRSESSATSVIKESNMVSVGTQSGLINMALIRDRTLRHSKEAELQVTQAELQRVKARNDKLSEQIGSLRRMVARTGDASTRDNSKAKQTIEQLQHELEQEKKSGQMRNSLCKRMHKDNEDLARTASSLEPLKACLLMIFKTCYDKLEPLLAHESMPEELTELDELSQELFNLPIHKIYKPKVSHGFMKRQENRLMKAIENDIQVDEVISVFGVVINELETKAKEAAQRRPCHV